MTLAVHGAPEFTNVLVKRFEPRIRSLIYRNVFRYNSADMCLEYEDISQICLEALWQATIRFDHTKKIPFDNYAILCIISKIKTVSKKAATVNKRDTSYIEDFEEEITTEDNNTILNTLTEIRKLMKDLDHKKAIIFYESILMGKSIREICVTHPELKKGFVAKNLPSLKRIRLERFSS